MRFRRINGLFLASGCLLTGGCPPVEEMVQPATEESLDQPIGAVEAEPLDAETVFDDAELISSTDGPPLEYSGSTTANTDHDTAIRIIPGVSGP